jgi:hypothetical protein
MPEHFYISPKHRHRTNAPRRKLRAGSKQEKRTSTPHKHRVMPNHCHLPLSQAQYGPQSVLELEREPDKQRKKKKRTKVDPKTEKVKARKKRWAPPNQDATTSHKPATATATTTSTKSPSPLLASHCTRNSASHSPSASSSPSAPSACVFSLVHSVLLTPQHSRCHAT